MYIICLQISACSRITDLTGYINIWEHALCQSRMVGKKCGLAETEKKHVLFQTYIIKVTLHTLLEQDAL